MRTSIRRPAAGGLKALAAPEARLDDSPARPGRERGRAGAGGGVRRPAGKARDGASARRCRA
ncbi:hypothetical protein GCM10010466_52960 [Planomonospora alba]|uniref:Uncharacterized protein n=1 Tax=Planomonospora alba TaxID=161354 RepID=A0ABP6NVD1_9ACTN